MGVPISVRRGKGNHRLTQPFCEGEPLYETDTGRIGYGDGNRYGGQLQPSAISMPAMGVVAAPQGRYRFSAAGELTLPVNTLETPDYIRHGEYIEVVVSPDGIQDAIDNNALCSVVVDDDSLIKTHKGEFALVEFDCVCNVHFVFNDNDQWELVL